MIERKTARLFIAALNLFGVSSPMAASHVTHTIAADQKMTHVNAASLKSIESTWLKVPSACKARGFYANPVSLENKEIAFHIQKIYKSFGV